MELALWPGLHLVIAAVPSPWGNRRALQPQPSTLLVLLNGGRTRVTLRPSACSLPIPVLEENFLQGTGPPYERLGCLHRLEPSSSQPRHMTQIWPITEVLSWAPVIGLKIST